MFGSRHLLNIAVAMRKIIIKLFSFNDLPKIPISFWRHTSRSKLSSSTRVIAINTPNINSTSPSWKDYIVSVRDIGSATGYNLLSSLPQNLQDVVEKVKDAGN